MASPGDGSGAGAEEAIAADVAVIAAMGDELSLRRYRLGRRIAGACLEAGRVDEALRHMIAALPLADTLLDEQHAELAEAYGFAGAVFEAGGRAAEAEQAYRRALGLKQQLVGEASPELALLLSRLGVLCRERGGLDEAERLLRRAAAVQESVIVLEAVVDAASAPLAMVHVELARVLRGQQVPAEAERLLLPALGVLRGAGLPPPELATVCSELGAVCEQQLKIDEAAKWFAEAADLLATPAAGGAAAGGDEGRRLDLAEAYASLGRLSGKQGALDDALGWTRKALGIHEELLDAQSPLLATTLNNIGALCQDKGEHAQALAYMSRALAIREAALPAGRMGLAGSYGWMANIHRSLGDDAAADKYAAQAFAFTTKGIDGGGVD